MLSGQNKTNNKLYDQLLIIQNTIEANKQYFDEETKKITEDPKETIASMMYQIKNQKSPSDNKDSLKAQDATAVVPANKKATPLEGGHYTKNGGMWTLKYEIS